MAAATKPIDHASNHADSMERKGETTLVHDHVSLPIDQPDHDHELRRQKFQSRAPPAVQANIQSDDQLVVITMNPMLKNSRELELGKTMLISGMASAVLLLAYGEKVGPQLFPAILVLLCLGIACLWNGVLLRNTIPDNLASLEELFGAFCVLLAFFSVIGSYLPPGLTWFPVACFVLCLMPFLISFSRAKAGVGARASKLDVC